MPKCKTCNGASTYAFACYEGGPVERKMCGDCQPDLAAIKSVIAASDEAGPTTDDKSCRHQLVLLLARYEELVFVLQPADWQTPKSRAQELADNLVVIGQIKTLVSHS